jgi:hypothetical protein
MGGRQNKRRAKGSTLPFREDVVDLGTFIFKRDPTTRTRRFAKRGHVLTNKLSEVVRTAVIRLRYLADMPCDCGSLHRNDCHEDRCVRLAAIRFEAHFWERWGITRYSPSGEMPEKVLALGREPDVLPIKRGSPKAPPKTA